MRHGWYHGKFEGMGYRMTIPRQAVLEVLSKTSDHLSAEDIYLSVHKKYPTVGLTTVYRTLELLERMGLVQKFDFGDNRARFELSEGPGKPRHHHHLVCTSCGRIIDYTDYIAEELELLQKTETGLSEKYRFEIQSHIINFYGLCERCRSM
ncbi:ferric uptake regulation protein [candidate division WOR_3 bacterium SM1_77]|uniref:Ferric uptake regulation protein n=1 Tax=candidate division WOR_3 bacterium SM1_77 TaxID=1703778 RepID=A0A0S8K309_UNCW3|nr:MAG: ferric uptake regulation protein [candidate division WOR_3 bacterium SM1_77]